VIVRADLQIIGTEPKPFEERALQEMNRPKAILTEVHRILPAGGQGQPGGGNGTKMPCHLFTTHIFMYFCIGLFAGFMSGTFGIGGGSVRIPLLNFAGLPLLTAFGINLWTIPFASTVACIEQKHHVDMRIALRMAVGGTVGSVVGALLAGLIRPLALAIIFVTVSVLTVVGIHLHRFAPRVSERMNPSSQAIVVGSFLLNLITGMRGGSGGTLFPPFLRALKLDVHRAIATSLFITIFTATAAGFVYWRRGDVLWLPALVVLLGSMIGAKIGSKASLRTPPLWLEMGLSVFVLILASLTIYKAV
jgi:uncharacterized membrane protein YfcA